MTAPLFFYLPFNKILVASKKDNSSMRAPTRDVQAYYCIKAESQLQDKKFSLIWGDHSFFSLCYNGSTDI